MNASFALDLGSKEEKENYTSIKNIVIFNVITIFERDNKNTLYKSMLICFVFLYIFFP